MTVISEVLVVCPVFMMMNPRMFGLLPFMDIFDLESVIVTVCCYQYEDVLKMNEASVIVTICCYQYEDIKNG